MAAIEIKVPDIGDFADVPVIEIHVEPGTVVQLEDSLITLESDKATLDVPSPAAGTVSELKVALGDWLSEGSLTLMLEADGAEGTEAASATAATDAPPTAAPAPVGAPHSGSADIECEVLVLGA